MEALVQEISMYAAKGISLDTIFLGGGTPSILDEKHIEKIMKAADAAFCVSKDAEITIEANPKTLTEKKLCTYRQAGINRLSIGAQSMDDAMLAFMERAHNKEDFLKNFDLARKAGFNNINVDLMFGIPGQTMELWQDSLKQLIDLAPEHISFYSLQLEEGTKFAKQYRDGIIDLPPVELDRAMYHRGIEMLKAAGYEHYEISNCAKPGVSCKHNLKYWDFDEYYAVGLGAHSFCYENGRKCNVSELDRYFDLIASGKLPEDVELYEVETMNDYIAEYVFTALRKGAGLSFGDFKNTFGIGFFERYPQQYEVLQDYAKRGLVEITDTHIRLTVLGMDCSNEIMAEFV